MTTDVQSNLWARHTAMLVAQKTAQTGTGFCDYEMRPIQGIGGFGEHAVDALGFNYEDFGMRDAQAVSCRICCGLFKESLGAMRLHRLSCGWSCGWVAAAGLGQP